MTTPKAKFAGLALIVARCGKFILGLMAPAWAGFYKGVAAYNRGDYATALRELPPLAEQDNSAESFENDIDHLFHFGLSRHLRESARRYDGDNPLTGR